MMTEKYGASRIRRSAFTLVELLVVMAITAILLGLIFGPMYQGFNLTNRARVQILAQDLARSIIERVNKEQSNSVYIFDNANMPINLWVKAKNGSGQIVTPVPFAWVDMVPPGRVIDQQGYQFLTQHPELIDPTTGNAIENPRLREELIRLAQAEGDTTGQKYLSLADVAVPSAPGRTFVRYFVGLRDNSTESDPGGQSGRPRKTYNNFYDELRHGSHTATIEEHNPYLLYRATVTPYLPNGLVDTRLFRVDNNGQPILFEPNFFYDNRTATSPGGNIPAAYPGWNDDNKDGVVNYSENWRAAARTLVPGDRADEVVVTREDDGKPVYFNNPMRGNNIEMKIVPQIRFQPNFVGNDAGAPARLSDRGNEAPNTAASSHRETYAHWTPGYTVFVYRGSFGGSSVSYFTWAGTGWADGSNNVRYCEFNSATGVTNGNGNSNPPGEDTGFNPLNPTALPATVDPNKFLMFGVDPRKGMINFSFPATLWMKDNLGQPLPSIYTSADANSHHVNEDLNSYRYISLINPPNVAVGTSPLAKIANLFIVPGTEVVIGPDMRPGPHYGMPITYTRVPRNSDPRRLGPNEFMINYDQLTNANVNDPLAAKGTIIFDSQDDAPGNPHSLPTLDAQGNQASTIRVTYQVQNNRPGDVVKADYLTRQLMTFVLGVRLYDKASGQPQQVTLNQQIRVRNQSR